MTHDTATGDRWPTENPSVTYRDASDREVAARVPVPPR